jgi:glycosyltransferase involved in cell wall biosynthesis
LVEAIHAALDPLNRACELVLVDDGSSDGSWELLKDMGRADKQLRAFRLENRSGQSAAMWAGIRAARGGLIVTLDADSRVEARAKGDSWLRITSSRIANWVRNKVSGETISDAGCCFRAFRRECVAEVKFFRGAHRFLPTLIKMEGFRVVEIPIGHDPRHAGHGHYGVWNRLLKTFADLLAVRWMKSRLIRYKVADSINSPP